MVCHVPVPTTVPAEIIRRLGGPEVVGEGLGLSKWTVWGWYRRGIPARQFPGLVRFAVENQISLSFEELFRAGKRGDEEADT